jgi:dihydroorotate dehydrogenase electron transfer subunit
LSRLFKASVLENRPINKDHYLLTLHPLEKIIQPEPGNFFMMSVDSGLDPLLKRPFSIHRRLRSDFQILYRVVGRGTGLLSERKPGDLLDVTGPLGNKFPAAGADNKMILIAGGLGMAPVFNLAEKFRKKKPLLFYGARNKEELLCIDELRSLGIEPVISTDDGSYGIKGNIIHAVKIFLSRRLSPLYERKAGVTRYRLYACGPKPMLIALSQLAATYGLKGYMALEQNMACGLGTCLGCVANTNKGYARVCKEGPVFKIEEIVWEKNFKTRNVGKV